MTKYAPIVLFAYNRPWHTEQTLNALSNNKLSKESDLFIFIDGVKDQQDLYAVENQRLIKEIVIKKKWCRNVHIEISEYNKGLADSIIDGVTRIVNQYGKIIVLEDDIVTSTGFLSYMNTALNIYHNTPEVMHISGYMYPTEEKLPETFFFNVPLCWGWATWKRAWDNLIVDADALWKYFEENNKWKQFNKLGGNYLQSQLEANKKGILKTWFVKWHASVLCKNGYTLYPNKTLVNNIGFDNTGENCESTANYNSPIVDSIEVQKIPLIENKEAQKIICNFYNPSITISQKINSFIFSHIPSLWKETCRKVILKMCCFAIPELRLLKDGNRHIYNSKIDGSCKIAKDCVIGNSQVGRYTYFSINCNITLTEIGSFCSFGPNVICGWGIHPTSGISTSPLFYSTWNQTGISLTKRDKIIQRKKIIIGNDVFIGANVIILDNVRIGDGAIIGAGTIVTKDIPPYAIVAGSPMRILRFRFNEDQVNSLLRIKWWEFSDKERLQQVEKYFFSIDEFITNEDKGIL